MGNFTYNEVAQEVEKQPQRKDERFKVPRDQQEDDEGQATS